MIRERFSGAAGARPGETMNLRGGRIVYSGSMVTVRPRSANCST